MGVEMRVTKAKVNLEKAERLRKLVERKTKIDAEILELKSHFRSCMGVKDALQCGETMLMTYVVHKKKVDRGRVARDYGADFLKPYLKPVVMNCLKVQKIKE